MKHEIWSIFFTKITGQIIALLFKTFLQWFLISCKININWKFMIQENSKWKCKAWKFKYFLQIELKSRSNCNVFFTKCKISKFFPWFPTCCWANNFFFKFNMILINVKSLKTWSHSCTKITIQIIALITMYCIWKFYQWFQNNCKIDIYWKFSVQKNFQWKLKSFELWSFLILKPIFYPILERSYTLSNWEITQLSQILDLSSLCW